MKFTGKSGFLISATLSCLSRTSRSLCYFTKKICLKALSPRTFTFMQNTTSLKCKQMYEQEEKIGWMHEPEAMRAKGDVNIQLYLVFSFSLSVLSMFTI